MSKIRCAWVTEDPLYIQYHDHEWGKPSYDDQYLFEMLSLEGAQAGLSWITILKRRENYRTAFDQFDPQIVSKYKEDEIERLLVDKGIIRNRRKIYSVIKNAQAVLQVQQEFGNFATYIWKFVGGEPIINRPKTDAEVPASTKLSMDMSKDLKKRGFTFVGPIICYSFMQATGMVNDHTKECFLSHETHEK